MSPQYSFSDLPAQSAVNHHAIVIGGSMAGMLTARVLADYFDRVTIIERDQLPAGPTARSGVPQARHLHVLLARGRAILEEMFPGFGAEMRDAGAHELDVANDTAWLTPGGWGINYPSAIKALTFTRDLLDWVVRGRVKANPPIRFLEECDVTGLLARDDRGAVTGVAVKFRPAAGDLAGTEKQLSAALVVDASGRASKLPIWLQALGYEAPAESVVNSHLGYASRLYKLPATMQPAFKGIFIQAAPPRHVRAGLAFPVEGGRWMVTLVGGDGDYAPTDEEGFLDFARSLRAPGLYDLIRDARPLTAISGYRNTENRRRHYERLARRPENLLIIGDGACAFNPVYGQGMTTAALGAQLLAELLHQQRRQRGADDLTGLAERFQKRLAKINHAPWMLATGEDYRYRSTEGGTAKVSDRLTHRYLDHVFQLATRSEAVRERFLQVQGMLKPPIALFHPAVALRVLGHWLRLTAGQQSTEVGLIAPFSNRVPPARF